MKSEKKFHQDSNLFPFLTVWYYTKAFQLKMNNITYKWTVFGKYRKMTIFREIWMWFGNDMWHFFGKFFFQKQWSLDQLIRSGCQNQTDHVTSGNIIFSKFWKFCLKHPVLLFFRVFCLGGLFWVLRNLFGNIDWKKSVLFRFGKMKYFWKWRKIPNSRILAKIEFC